MKLGQLGLAVLLPLGNGLCPPPLNPGSAILNSIGPRWRPDFGVDNIVIGFGELDVWGGVLVVVGLYVRGNSVLDLKVGFANVRGGLVASLE